MQRGASGGPVLLLLRAMQSTTTHAPQRPPARTGTLHSVRLPSTHAGCHPSTTMFCLLRCRRAPDLFHAHYRAHVRIWRCGLCGVAALLLCVCECVWSAARAVRGRARCNWQACLWARAA
jgi:hypothetical protein